MLILCAWSFKKMYCKATWSAVSWIQCCINKIIIIITDCKHSNADDTWNVNTVLNDAKLVGKILTIENNQMFQVLQSQISLDKVTQFQFGHLPTARRTVGIAVGRWVWATCCQFYLPPPPPPPDKGYCRPLASEGELNVRMVVFEFTEVVDPKMGSYEQLVPGNGEQGSRPKLHLFDFFLALLEINIWLK